MTLVVVETAQTQCPNCRSILRVERRFIQAEDSRVRCGQCLFVFSARDHQVQNRTQKQPSSVPERAPSSQSAPVRRAVVSDQSVVHKKPTMEGTPRQQNKAPDSGGQPVSRESRKPLSEWPAQPQEKFPDEFNDTNHHEPRIDIEDWTLNNDPVHWGLGSDSKEQSSPVHSSHKHSSESIDHDEIVDLFTKAVDQAHQSNQSEKPLDMPESVMAYGQSEGVHFRREPRGRKALNSFKNPVMKGANQTFGAWGSAVIGLMFVVIIAVAIIWGNRESLAQSRFSRPIVASVCGLLGCQLAPIRDVDVITLVRRQVYSHPQVPNALVISILMRNDATFPQPFPGVRVKMSDQRGVSIAERDFGAELYRNNFADGGLMAPGVNEQITLEVADPGENANAFSFTFY